jgi:hypothetical protein
MAQRDPVNMLTRYGNPQTLSHAAETDENPREVWMFKKLPKRFW